MYFLKFKLIKSNWKAEGGRAHQSEASLKYSLSAKQSFETYLYTFPRFLGGRRDSAAF